MWMWQFLKFSSRWASVSHLVCCADVSASSRGLLSLADISNVSALSWACLLGCWGGDQPSPAWPKARADMSLPQTTETCWDQGTAEVWSYSMQYCLSLDPQIYLKHFPLYSSFTRLPWCEKQRMAKRAVDDKGRETKISSQKPRCQS